MAAIDAISKGSIGSGQAAGKANPAPVSGFDLLFAVSSGAPAEGDVPAFAVGQDVLIASDGQALPLSGLPEIDADATTSLDVVVPLLEADLDPEWHFSNVVISPDIDDDLMQDTQALASVMPLPASPAAQEDVNLAALPMSSSVPLSADDDQKDLVSLDDVDDLGASLALAAFAAALTPSVMPPGPEAERHSNHQLTDASASVQPNIKDALAPSLTLQGQLSPKGEDGQPSYPATASEPAKTSLNIEPQLEDGVPNSLKQSGSQQPHVGRATNDATSAQTQTAERATNDLDAFVKSQSEPSTTTVARLQINPINTVATDQFATKDQQAADTRDYPAQFLASPESAEPVAASFEQLQPASKIQTVSANLAQNLATILPERTSELLAPNSASPIIAQMRQTLDTRDASWRERMVTQVMGSARNGVQSISITLRPKSLGDIQLNIEINSSETTVRIITETASAAKLLLANEDVLSHLMDQAGVRLTSMSAQQMATAGWNGLASGQAGAQNSGGQSGRDGAGGRKERVRGAEAARAEPAPTLKLGDNAQLGINLIA